MWIVIIASVIAFFLSYSESKGKLRGGLKFGFIIVTAIEAIHYNYGSDYMGYLEAYRLLDGDSISFSSFAEGSLLQFEPGWMTLYSLMKLIFNGKDIGFFALVAILSIIQNVIYYKLIKKYVPKDYWFLGMFIYLFSAYELYLINMSMLRQGFTIALFVSCFDCIREKKIIKAALIILVAFTIHKSAILMLPVIFWGYLPRKYAKLMACTMFLLFCLFFISANVLSSSISLLQNFAVIDDFLETYSLDSESANYGVGFIIRMIPFLLYLFILMKYKDALTDEHYSLISLTAAGFIIEPFGSVTEMIARITYYFVGLSVAALPIAISYLKSPRSRFVIASIYIIFTMFTYINFFSTSIIHKSYAVYHTIFETL